MQLLRTVAAWRPDYDDFDHPATATRIAMRSLARRILELNNEVADLDDLIEPLVTDLGARLIERPCIGIETAGQLLVTAGDNPGASGPKPPGRCSAGWRRCPPPPARLIATASTVAATVKPTEPST